VHQTVEFAVPLLTAATFQAASRATVASVTQEMDSAAQVRESVFKVYGNQEPRLM